MIEVALLRYEELLREWGPRFDLMSSGDLEHLRERHIQDSLRLLPLLADVPPGPCIDVGSGAGLPGIPLAIASGRPWRLVEPRQKRAGFLEEVVRQLGLDCKVVARSAEELHGDPDFRGTHMFATARALATPEVALKLLQPLLSATGTGAIFIGRDVAPPEGSRTWEPGIAIFKGDATQRGS